MYKITSTLTLNGMTFTNKSFSRFIHSITHLEALEMKGCNFDYLEYRKVKVNDKTRINIRFLKIKILENNVDEILFILKILSKWNSFKQNLKKIEIVNDIDVNEANKSIKKIGYDAYVICRTDRGLKFPS